MNDSAHPLAQCQDFLQAAAGKFASGFSTSLASLLAGAADVRPVGLELLWPGQYLRSFAEPSCCFLFAANPASGETFEAGRLEFSPALASAMVDLLLGGPSLRKPGHEITVVDRHVLGPVVGQACVICNDSCRTAMEFIAGAQAEPVQDVHAAMMTFEVFLADVQGTMKLAILDRALPTRQQEGPPQVTISACIQEQIGPAELANISVGDIIATEASPQGEVVVCVDGVKKYYAHLGQFNGKRAITITRKVE